MEKRKKSLWKKVAVTVAIVSVLLTAVTYAGFSLFFEDHYYYQTKINGDDYSYKTPVEAEAIMYREFQEYSLEIQGREGMYDTILPADIDMEYIVDDSFINVKKEQSPLLWILGFFKEYSYDIPQLVEYNEDILDEKIDGLTFFKKENIRAPSDAYLTYSSEGKCYLVADSSPGTDILRKKAVQVIKEAIGSMERSVNLDEKDCYRYAKVNADDETLNELADQANKYISAKIVYNWNGSDVVVDSDVISGWVVITKDSVALDDEKIREFVTEQAKLYDTYGKNRIFHTTDGREIELKSGAYGWKTNKETEIEALTTAIKNAETQIREPAYIYTAAVQGQQDIGNSYVEIDLSSQHLYLYVEGVMTLESDFVSGNASRGWNTPAGVFGLTYKSKNAVLRGEGYETPVNYWMPFNGNIGMHDATWRGSFGGQIYETSGSHGCINLPLENAKIIYEYIYTGFPVVCYY
ncbi:peptidoglycan transpeptidase precursor (ErfK-YbiS-YhnG family) [Kineothrix alysoides]|uniref:Peptidoglycan transpeptidase (ErfK-YbiS-YhnG family) n=1 Tax=Kineothrix alysoides TaxID=1469948 RepID=A0A4R1QSX0_9FIRM|nr:peptidoglycan binding domain-containing protein [Kineothrix alysoides]TCL56999.1 peptidoglycan transpeptidase precursor (ErfK-YbiS-YhnG family) [Kineothrix alysoides]